MDRSPQSVCHKNTLKLLTWITFQRSGPPDRIVL